MDWNKYGFVMASEYRKKVVAALGPKPKTPKQIAFETRIYLSHISSTLTELVSMGIVVCLTPQLKRGRIYQLTEEGKEIAEFMNK